jgi:hypothetical protein
MNTPSESSLSSASASDVAGRKYRKLGTVPETVVREIRDTDVPDVSRKGLADDIVILTQCVASLSHWPV